MCANTKIERNVSKWKYFFRQLLISSGVWVWLFLHGLNMGTPTVLVAQLRQEANSTEAVTAAEASWLPAIGVYCSIPWEFILSITAAFKGRKICQLVVCIFTMISYVIFYCSSNIKLIMISQLFEGATRTSYLTTAIFVLTEYTSAEYRGLFLTIKSATFFWGIVVANIIGTFFHWKTIACIGLTLSVYSTVTVYFWPESPLWLAKQGKFNECIISNEWLQGVSVKSTKDLNNYINSNKTVKGTVSLKQQIISTKTVIITKQFYKPIYLAILLFLMYSFSGKIVFTIYALEILSKIMHDKSSAYVGMLILDGVTVFSMYVGCGLAKLLNRRTMLLISSTISITFLFLTSIYIYLIKLLIVSGDTYISLSLLAGFSIAVGVGPLILITTISGELMPIESRSLAILLNSLAVNIIAGSLFKVSPYIFKYFDIHGTFFFFGVTSTVCLVVTYICLPETKDKTLQEIADCIIDLKPLAEPGAEICDAAQAGLLKDYVKVH